ncbi:DUF721 domain-containing protein [Candidatus Gracilibacteria bacterium]|jgi:hypothetical protein|nr:DUF721 domain-containing protein [Candidatus Gracilibacteria bacterium]
MFSDFQSLFNKSAHKLGIHRQLTSSYICEVCRQTLDSLSSNIAKECQVISYNKGIIKIQTNHPIVSQQLHGQSQLLIETINKRLGRNSITKITIQSS